MPLGLKAHGYRLHLAYVIPMLLYIGCHYSSGAHYTILSVSADTSPIFFGRTAANHYPEVSNDVFSLGADSVHPEVRLRAYSRHSFLARFMRNSPVISLRRLVVKQVAHFTMHCALPPSYAWRCQNVHRVGSLKWRSSC